MRIWKKLYQNHSFPVKPFRSIYTFVLDKTQNYLFQNIFHFLDRLNILFPTNYAWKKAVIKEINALHEHNNFILIFLVVQEIPLIQLVYYSYINYIVVGLRPVRCCYCCCCCSYSTNPPREAYVMTKPVGLRFSVNVRFSFTWSRFPSGQFKTKWWCRYSFFLFLWNTDV